MWCNNPCSASIHCLHYMYFSLSTSVNNPCSVLFQIRKNIACHRDNISCGLPCNNELPCKQHKCTKVCHSVSLPTKTTNYCIKGNIHLRFMFAPLHSLSCECKTRRITMLILSLFKYNFVWTNSRLFASFKGEKLHGAKTTLYQERIY